MSKREEQRVATRGRILDAAVASLVESGVTATTTLEVQQRARVSRGALLHHFATREELFGAAVGLLVDSNERAVRDELAAAPVHGDPLSRALQVLLAVIRRPSFLAELELWAVARTDEGLRRVLRRAEGAARRDLHRVIGDVLGPEITSAPGYPVVAELTVQLLRGMAISEVLRGPGTGVEELMDQWSRIIRPLLTAPPRSAVVEEDDR